MIEKLAMEKLFSIAIRNDTISKTDECEFIEIYTNLGRANVIRFSEEYKMAPFVAQSSILYKIDTEYWTKVIDKYKFRNTLVKDLCEDLFTNFEGAGVNKIFLYENFGALLSSGLCISQFSSGDIDIHACPSNRLKIDKILQESGFYAIDSNSYSELVKTEYVNPDFFEVISDRGFAVNIMWVALSRAKIDTSLSFNDNDFWYNCRKVTGTSIIIPNVNVLTYLCLLHISIHGFTRAPGIRLYYDSLATDRQKPDMSKVIDYAKRNHNLVKLAVAVELSTKLVKLNFISVANEKFSILHRFKLLILRSILFNERSGTIRNKEHILKNLATEILSSDNTALVTLCRIVIPRRDWLKKTYSQETNELNIMKAYFLHWKNLLNRYDRKKRRMFIN
jgi:hypothetical protein